MYFTFKNMKFCVEIPEIPMLTDIKVLIFDALPNEHHNLCTYFISAYNL